MLFVNFLYFIECSRIKHSVLYYCQLMVPKLLSTYFGTRWVDYYSNNQHGTTNQHVVSRTLKRCWFKINIFCINRFAIKDLKEPVIWRSTWVSIQHPVEDPNRPSPQCTSVQSVTKASRNPVSWRDISEFTQVMGKKTQPTAILHKRRIQIIRIYIKDID